MVLNYGSNLLFVFVSAILSFRFPAALSSYVGKRLTSWLSCGRYFFVFVSLSAKSVLGHVWYSIVSISGLRLTCMLRMFSGY